MNGFSTLGGDSLGDQVAENIRRAILVGDLKPGERLVEHELAEQMGLSRGPIRDAFQMLAHKGLVVTYPRRGTFVYQLSKGEARELLHFRAALEGGASRLVAERQPQQAFADMESLVEQMENFSEAGNMETPRDLDIDFHRTLIEASGNRWMLRAWMDLHPFVWLLIGPVRPTAEENAHFGERHRKLFDALYSGDPDTAETAMRTHVLGPLSKLPVVDAWPGEDGVQITGATAPAD